MFVVAGRGRLGPERITSGFEVWTFERRRAVQLCTPGWCGATRARIVTVAWMLPTLLDLALLDPMVAAAKYASWWIVGWMLAGSLRRMDPELQLLLVGNIAWMMASAGMLYIDAPARLCVNDLQDGQRQTGIALVLLALVLGALALRQLVQPGAARTADDPDRPAPAPL